MRKQHHEKLEVVVVQVLTEKVVGAGAGQLLGIDGPAAVTDTLYVPAVVRSRGPIEPLLVLSHDPSAVLSVVLNPEVVFVNTVPEGVVTVHVTEVEDGRGVTLVLKETAAELPGPMHPLTLAVAVATVGQVQPARVILALAT